MAQHKDDFGPSTNLVRQFAEILKALGPAEWQKVAEGSRHTSSLWKGVWRDIATRSARSSVRRAGLDPEKVRAGWAIADVVDKRLGELGPHDGGQARWDPVDLGLEVDDVVEALVASHRIQHEDVQRIYRPFEHICPLAELVRLARQRAHLEKVNRGGVSKRLDESDPVL